MRDQIWRSFDKIQAEPELIEKTVIRLQKKRGTKKGFLSVLQKKTTMVASAALLLLVTVLSYQFYFVSSAYVDLDMNSSIELTINRYDRVIQVKAYNEEGRSTINQVRVKHKKYQEAVALLLSDLVEEESWQEDPFLFITIQAPEQSRQNRMLRSLNEMVSQSFDDNQDPLTSKIFAVPGDVKKKAHSHQMSPAKYMAIETLLATDPELTWEGCSSHSIEQISRSIENQKDHHSSKNPH